MDVRIKLMCLVLLSVSAGLATRFGHFIVLFLVTCTGLVVAKLPIRALLKDMRFIIVMMALIIITRGAEGLPLAARLAIVALASAVLTGTTTLITLKNAIEWALRPVPFVNEAKAATMVNLTFVLIPVIFDCYSEMMEAQKSRNVTLVKNPIRRIKLIALPLLGRMLQKCDEMVYAMEARCYSYERTRPKSP